MRDAASLATLAAIDESVVLLSVVTTTQECRNGQLGSTEQHSGSRVGRAGDAQPTQPA